MPPFSYRLIQWQKQNGRHHLPWQGTNPYHVWLSEIMLQQTQVTTVLPYFQRFLQHFPTIIDLANASQDDVLALWAGLGYYNRGRNLHRAALQIVNIFNGQFPTQRQQLETLAGIGRSTAAAISVFAFNQKEAILDGNVKRILARHQGVFGAINDAKTIRELWNIAENLLPNNELSAYTQGLMDLGSAVCIRKPICGRCPIREDCFAFLNQKTHELPSKKTKKPLIEKQINLSLQIDSKRILLEKRSDNGIWRSLWAFPEIHDFSPQNTDIFATISHRLTHRLLTINLIKNNQLTFENARWFLLAEVEKLGMPAPLRKFLNSIMNDSIFMD